MESLLRRRLPRRCAVEPRCHAGIRCVVQEVTYYSERDHATAQMLRLAQPQEEQLLLVRKKHLRNLRELYNDRQRMNLQVRPPRL